MSRLLRATALMILVAACGGGNYSAPRNLNDACAILKERGKYYKEMKRTQRRWGVPISVQMATLYQESKFVGNARTPHQFVLGVIPMGRQSSAYGYSQALDATWDEYKDVRGGRGAKRDDFGDAVDFMGWYMDETTRKLGISKGDAANQYLAYHEGRAGYARGSYRSKPWLVNVANSVDARARLYHAQLKQCGKA
ncbi:lytic transglycosylase [Falsihalocynthiibacter sp. SS001]|uniref:transglycosylase SLT domain-containing protein n=1 Tax=Falsihalocynthiibacter sp. SS001 TaxID=3349698 RepID=UPI0036D40533